MKAYQTVRALSAIAAFSALACGVSAQVSQSVSVQVNLSSQCRAEVGAAPVINFGAYTAFGAEKDLKDAAAVKFECTRGFGSPTATWDTSAGTASGVGVLAGLQYTLTVKTAARSNGGDASVTSTGQPDVVSYSIDAYMPGGQAGGTAGATTGATVSDSHTRTLMVTF